MKEKVFSPVCGNSLMRGVFSTLDKVLDSSAPVFVTGETGVGKEVVTDYIHRNGNRAEYPCLKINCAALPKELIESELFGSIRGSYTGSHSTQEGLFRSAGRGILVLDEIGEMDIKAQTKLLRVLQDKLVRPVGGVKDFDIHCRVIASTNKDPLQSIANGKLRSDLFYRLNVVRIEVPSLSDRGEDIPLLAKLFIEKYSKEEGKEIRCSIEPDLFKFLSKLSWPGNVRQLENEIRRVIIMNEGEEISPSNFDFVRPEKLLANLTLFERNERSLILKVLGETKGDKLRASSRLGIGRQTLYNKISKYEMDDEIRLVKKIS